MRLYQSIGGVYEVIIPEMLISRIRERILEKSLTERPPRGRLLQSLRRCNSENGSVDINYWRLAYADDFTFWHDLIGINRYIDADGQLDRTFLPRCARQDTVEYEFVDKETA